MVEFLRDWHSVVKPLMTMKMMTAKTMMMMMMMMMTMTTMMMMMMMVVMVIFLTSGIGMAGIDAAVKPIARKVRKTFKVDGIALLLFLIMTTIVVLRL